MSISGGTLPGIPGSGGAGGAMEERYSPSSRALTTCARGSIRQRSTALGGNWLKQRAPRERSYAADARACTGRYCDVFTYANCLRPVSSISKRTENTHVTRRGQRSCGYELVAWRGRHAACGCTRLRVLQGGRMECLNLVQQRQADFVPVDPEDMYVASKIPNQDFVVFQVYRTDDEPDAEFRFEAVIVVHKDLPINNLDQLQGLKSCHTGVNRNVGYKIPLTMLMKRSVFPKMNNHSISPKENELKALSRFFSQSCIVGAWSPNPKTDSYWKSKYSQLCALCEYPNKCNYPDNFSGYEGALRCLAHNGGQVAFTKVIFVKKFFGLPVGTIPASPSNENPDEFRYLCTDGSKVPIRDKPCTWAARPWQGLLGHQDVLAKLTPLREKIKQLADAGASTKPEWFTSVLGLTKKTHHVADNISIKPVDYLKKANYTEVIERGHGPPEHVVRLCITSNVALAKCRAMAVFAFSRDIRPRLDCVQEPSAADCLRSSQSEWAYEERPLCIPQVQDNGSDLASVDDMQVASASKQYLLHPVFHEVYGAGDVKTPHYAVAVVKKNTQYDKIEDLRGKRFENYFSAPLHINSVQAFLCTSESPEFARTECLSPTYIYNKTVQPPVAVHRSCHDPFGSFSGFFAPIYLLKNKRLITSNQCVNDLKNFFSEGLCLPQAEKPENNPAGEDVSLLTKQCADDASPSKCLQDDRGDVAFMSSADLSNLDSSAYELLCLNKENGGRHALANYSTCNIAVAPSRTWLSAKDFQSDVSIAHTPLSLAKLLKNRKDLFNIYGEFLKRDNVIFKNTATGFAATDNVDFEKFKAIHDVISACGISYLI
ncbi:Transferrin [Eumeta japonica]|uniref:Transferrin n=1 Tax=Eumeta variegata TaxID=151549 RepID=A0A4C1SHK5_EUMVA|nr:Transferrin [Eumeta japonica]